MKGCPASHESVRGRASAVVSTLKPCDWTTCATSLQVATCEKFPFSDLEESDSPEVTDMVLAEETEVTPLGLIWPGTGFEL